MKRRKARERKSKRRTIIGHNKILEPVEVRQIWDYLRGGMRSFVTRRFFTPESIAGRRTILMVDILLGAGLRSVELVTLRLGDTPEYLGANKIEIYKSKYNKDREVPISTALAEAISKYIQDIRPKTMKAGQIRSDPKKPLFYSRHHKPYTYIDKRRQLRATSSFYRMIRGLGLHAGLQKPVCPHMFRHTYATYALRQLGGDLVRVQTLLGHSDIRITRQYTHLCTCPKELGNRLDFRLEQSAVRGGLPCSRKEM